MHQLATQRNLTLLLLFGMVAVVGSALAFEHLAGYIPCKLCLGQRVPYYAGIPVAAIATLSLFFAAPKAAPGIVTRAALAICAALMVWSLVLAVRHSGVEWGWWPGPTDCGAVSNGISADVGDLLNDLTAKKPPSCDKAAVRFLGLSFAGWNAIASAGLLAIALVALRRK